MTVGVDTSVIVAAVHANHPMHGPAAQWLDSALAAQDVVVSHHTVLESYAVLTRLPSPYRLSPTEASEVLEKTLRGNAQVAEFSSRDIWSTLELIVAVPAAGGAAYDAFIIDTMRAANVDVIVTYNTGDFRRIAPDMRVVDPSAL